MKPALFEGTSSSPEYAVHLATGVLGKIIGHRSDGAIRYSKQDCWCKFEWAEGPSEASTPGLPTVSLPKKFRIVEADDPGQATSLVCTKCGREASVFDMSCRKCGEVLTRFRTDNPPSLEEELAARLRAIRAHVEFVGDADISPKAKRAILDMCLGWKPGTRKGIKLTSV